MIKFDFIVKFRNFVVKKGSLILLKIGSDEVQGRWKKSIFGDCDVTIFMLRKFDFTVEISKILVQKHQRGEAVFSLLKKKRKYFDKMKKRGDPFTTHHVWKRENLFTNISKDFLYKFPTRLVLHVVCWNSTRASLARAVTSLVMSDLPTYWAQKGPQKFIINFTNKVHGELPPSLPPEKGSPIWLKICIKKVHGV